METGCDYLGLEKRLGFNINHSESCNKEQQMGPTE